MASIDHDQEQATRFHGKPLNIIPLKYSIIANTREKINIKDKYLSVLASGEKLGAFSLSEPQSGSDASNMLTTAIKKDEYLYLFPKSKKYFYNKNKTYIKLIPKMKDERYRTRIKILSTSPLFVRALPGFVWYVYSQQAIERLFERLFLTPKKNNFYQRENPHFY